MTLPPAPAAEQEDARGPVTGLPARFVPDA
jgi:hypothetical protein